MIRSILAGLVFLCVSPSIGHGQNVQATVQSWSQIEPGSIPNIEANISIAGTFTRSDGSLASYSVPATLIYAARLQNCNKVGIVDPTLSTLLEVFPTAGQEAVAEVLRLTTGDTFLGRGYTYLSVQWNKLVTDRLGGGNIERATDGYRIVVDSATLLRNPAVFIQQGPLPSLPCPAQIVVGYGNSQTGFFLRDFYLKNQNAHGAFDGVLLQGTGDRCRTLTDAAPLFAYSNCDDMLPQHGKIIVLNSETDVLMFQAWKVRAAAANYRIYDVAGVSHIPKNILDLSAFGATRQLPVDWNPVVRAMLVNLQNWILGIAPPSSTTISGRETSGTFQIERDNFGNALGGIRLPHMISEKNGKPAGAPLGTYVGIENLSLCSFPPQYCFVILGGAFTPFSASQLESLYPNHGRYVTAVVRGAVLAAHNRHILRSEVSRYIRSAARSNIGR